MENKMCIEDMIRSRLFEMQDLGYRDFNSKLIPNVDKNTVIGVRTPDLRKFAKEVFKMSEHKNFLANLPHKYYEENNLHGFIIEQIKDYDLCVKQLDLFLPYVDNWATCDLIRPKIFKKYPNELIVKIKEWINSQKTFTVRFGIEMLMRFYLNENFKSEYLELVSKIKSEEYYVNMMIAWYFATALAKQYDSALPYIESKKLSAWTHNRTIQKAVESYRITDEQKKYLRTLKIK
jgi:3-methyladenine DNA glycosylase AlkD